MVIARTLPSAADQVYTWLVPLHSDYDSLAPGSRMEAG